MTIADSDKNGRHFTIRDRNAAFDSLSEVDKRVAIARDVIAQVLLKKFIPEAGFYVQDGTETCNVCAIGAIAVSLFNGMARQQCASIHNSALVEYFSHDQLREMEAAFENCAYTRLDNCATARDYTELWDDAEGEPYYSDNTRLLLIFTNVINNKGRFVPETLENEIEAFQRDGVALFNAAAGVAVTVP